MSGNACVSYLHPYFRYTYMENARRKVASFAYERYWKEKREQFDSVLFFSRGRYDQFVTKAQAAGIPLERLRLERDAHPAMAMTADELARFSTALECNLIFKTFKGDTTLYFQFSSPLSPAKAGELFTLARALAFKELEESIQATPRNPDDSAIPKDAFVDGIILARFFEKFSLGVSIPGEIARDQAAGIRRQVEEYLDAVAPVIQSGFDRLAHKNLSYGDPSQLVSLKTKLGDGFQAASTENGFAKSVFNPYGPLHDGLGRRVAAQKGMLRVTVLFTPGNAANASPFVDDQLGSFQQWLEQSLGDPKKIDRD